MSLLCGYYLRHYGPSYEPCRSSGISKPFPLNLIPDRHIRSRSIPLRTDRTCLNRGCVPSKHLLEAARIYYEPLSNKFKGIETKQARVDINELIKVKTELLDSLREMKYYNKHF